MSDTTAIAVTSEAVSRWDNREMLDTLKKTVCNGATDAQFKMFMEIVKATGLDPFLKEIWYVPSVGVMAARDGYLRVANEHPMFDGMQTTVERDNAGIPIKATCSVWRKDRSHPITCEAYYNEYKKNGNIWATYKSAMISKVAEVLALKRSFAIHGVVSEEEVGEQAPPEPTRAEKAQAAKELGERKVAMLTAGAPRQEVEALAPIIHDAVEVEPLEETLQASVEQANSKWISQMMPAFQEIKDGLLGETEYRAILKAEGYANKQALMKKGHTEARRVYKIMAARLIAIKREIAEREANEALGV